MYCDSFTLIKFKEFCEKHKVKNTFANFIVWKDNFRNK